MKNLYNKIYNAVNEGIQKALLINPDVSINYSYYKIDNNLDIIQVLNSQVHKFIKNPTIDNYNEISLYSMKGKYKYTVNNFEEFSDIVKGMLDIIGDIDLSWINTVNVLSFIMDDNSELSLNEINDYNKENVIFVKFDNIQQFNHPIIIHKKVLSTDNKRWSDFFDDIKHSDDNGYENTRDVKDKVDAGIIKLENYQLFDLYFNIRTKYPDIELLDYDIYIPAKNELKFLSNNIKFINYILTYINDMQVNLNINSGSWWSSTQWFDAKSTVWYLKDGKITIEHYGGKYLKCSAVPLFAKMS